MNRAEKEGDRRFESQLGQAVEAACRRVDHLTVAGRGVLDAVETTTDHLAEGPWMALEEARRERLLDLLGGLVARLEGPGGMVYPNPIGVSRPT